MGLVSNIAWGFNAFLRAAKHVKDSDGVAKLKSRVEATYKKIQSHVLKLLSDSCKKLVADAVAAEADARATMTSKVPALFGAVGHVVAVGEETLPGHVVAVADSPDALRLKECMAAMYSYSDVPMDAVAILKQLAVGASEAACVVLALDDAVLGTLKLVDHPSIDHLNKTFCELAVLQNCLRPLKDRESRQALAMQAQMLVSKRLKAPNKLGDGVQKLLDRSLSSKKGDA